MKEKFEKLVAGLCALKNLGPPQPYIDGAPINVDGTMCILIYKGDPLPDHFFLYVVFGYVARNNEAASFRSLLHHNHDGFEGRGPGFCLSATTGKIGHVVSIGLDETNPDQLASSMVYYARMASEWRAAQHASGNRAGQTN